MTTLCRARNTEAYDVTNNDVKVAATNFRERFDGDEANVADRKTNATTLVNEYYDLVTDFYEYGWGTNFHFAPRFKDESFSEAIARHEYFLALKGEFKAGDRILDLGCGVGGPLRNIARFSGAHVTGVNNNAYQIHRAQKLDADVGLGPKSTSYIKSDFNTMPVESGTIDGAYAIEATCHAADKVKCFSEIFRTLKPGAKFVCYEWITTDKYDEGNAEHRKIRHGIELGNGLPTLETAEVVKDALRESGFEVLEAYDLCRRFKEQNIKSHEWHEPLQGNYTSLKGLRASPIGRALTSTMVWCMERLRLAPAGTKDTADFLEEGAHYLVKGGELDLFTPSYFFMARKPLK